MTVLATDEHAIAALVEIVGTPSVSGAESEAVSRFVRIATELGFRAHTDEAGNGIAWRGPDSAANTICMLGHIDTVPGDMPVRIDDGVLHGRGSVDAKGPLIAHLFAAARAEIPNDTAIVVVAAVGEESTGSPGARHLVRTLTPDACIIAEPSGWQGVTLGYKGRLIVDAACARDEAHTAGPEGSACDALLAWWADVRETCDALADNAAVFDRVQHRVQAMSSASDGLVERATLRGGFRLPPAVAPDALAERISALAHRHGVTVVYEGREHAHRSERNDAVARALTAGVRALDGSPRPIVKTGTSDMCVVAPHWGCPIAAYGPGDSALDHTPNERIDLAEFARSIEVLRVALRVLADEFMASRPPEVRVTARDIATKRTESP